jgi:photosystem II stability/assembly factor-like uncharacterized protein
MAKSTAVKARTGRAGKRPPQRGTVHRWIPVVGIAAAVVAAGAIVWVLSDGGDAGSPSASIEHVHGLGINPADSTLYAAAHNGVFRLPADGPARRVGDGRQDTMGFTIAGRNHFLASGHPAPGDGGARHLGLIESTDGGVTWRELSLRGGADFHALRYQHDTVYGYNSTNGQLLVSQDRRTWQTRSSMALRDFVVSPTSSQMLVAASLQGLLRSADGGRTWKPAGGQSLHLLAWDRADRLWAITAGGDVLRSADGGTAWSAAGKLPGAGTAFAAYGDDLYASVHEQGIFRSPDAGVTWTRIYP